jgi:hypothetical protein
VQPGQEVLFLQKTDLFPVMNRCIQSPELSVEVLFPENRFRTCVSIRLVVTSSPSRRHVQLSGVRSVCLPGIFIVNSAQEEARSE